MDTTGAAIGISFPVVPLEGWNRVGGDPACGTGMSAFHVNLPRSAGLMPVPERASL